ncbi:jg12083 [Pararge aegeria aegeria]|uniref:Jg12083 protein n=1 Tax=Pararge aegeria aegeria TaxID=348720 RepID=A0A8S4QWG9_9NEOP|nr:jg12083 [Pararge aegeria aegeria]
MTPNDKYEIYYYKRNAQFFIIVLCVFAIVSSSYGEVSHRSTRRSKYNYIVRCTRRFTPGLCMDPVIPVWTFVFHQQNCTTGARIASPHTLDACVDANRWSTYKSARRDSGDDADGTDIEEDEYDPPRIEHNLNGPAPTLDVKTADHNDWAVTVDIDDVR